MTGARPTDASSTPGVIVGPSAWRAEDVADPTAWTLELHEDTIGELVEVVGALADRGVTAATVAGGDFDLGALASVRESALRLLDRGPGFAVLTGLPVDRLGPDRAAIAYWGIGTCLGDPLPQNRFGDRLYTVQDETGLGYAGVRGSKSAAALIFHTDSASAFANSVPDIFGLLAVRTAKSGGASLLVSGHAVYNALLAGFPDSVERLFGLFYFDRAEEAIEGEEPTSTAPIFAPSEDKVAIRYNRAWIERGHQLAGVALAGEDRSALDALDSILMDPSFAVSFSLQPGDILLVNNRVVLHNRTAFIDHDDPRLSRLLLRLWLGRRN